MSSKTLKPDEAAKRIVAELLPDLPAERQAAVRKAIEDAMDDWGGLCSSLEGVQ